MPGSRAPSDVITARTQLDGAQAQLINAGAARAQFEHAIAVLVGHAPADLSIPPGRRSRSCRCRRRACPARCCERRPDIAAAERAMAEDNALVGVQVGAYYPDLSLSALGGYAANPIGGLFSVCNTLWSLGASLSGTLVRGRHPQSPAVAAARDSPMMRVVAELPTDRADGVPGCGGRSLQPADSCPAGCGGGGGGEPTRSKALQISLNEYQAGTVTYTTVVTAQLTLLSDQEQALTVQQDRLLASVSLFQDLGGGFKASDLPSAAQMQAKLPFAP